MISRWNRALTLLYFLLAPFPAYSEESGVSTSSEIASRIKIGALFSLSGWGASGGQTELDATVLAVEDINALGGVAGRQIELIVEDNRSSPPGSVAAFNKLAEINNVVAVLGPNWTEFSEVVAPQSTRLKIPTLAASGFTQTPAQGADLYFFSALPAFSVQVKPLADHLIAKQHKRIAILKSTSSYFENIADGLLEDLKQANIFPILTETFNPQESDFRSVLLKLRDQKVDGIVTFLLESGELASFFKQARALKLGIPLYAHDISYDESIEKNRSIANGVIFFKYEMPIGEDLTKRFQAKFNKTPTVGVPKAYDNVFVLKQAIERCGGARVEIRRCLAETDYQGVSGRVRFDGKGRILEPLPITRLYQVVGGDYEPLEVSP